MTVQCVRGNVTVVLALTFIFGVARLCGTCWVTAIAGGGAVTAVFLCVGPVGRMGTVVELTRCPCLPRCDRRGLNLSNTNLAGSIASTVSALTTLQVLDLSNNQLVGTLPSTLSACTALVSLLLTNNALSGGIPSTITVLTRLPRRLARAIGSLHHYRCPACVWRFAALPAPALLTLTVVAGHFYEIFCMILYCASPAAESWS